MRNLSVNKQLRADLMLIVVTIFWGAAYLFMKIATESLEPFTLIAYRFIIAFLLSAIIFYKRMIQINWKIIKYSFVLGTILFFIFTTITVGITSTSVSNAGFLVSLSVVFVPILAAIFLKQKPEAKVLVGVCCALFGIGLLTLNSQLQLGSGDLLCILCALFYSVHILVTDKFTKGVDSIVLGVTQLGICGLWGLLFSFVFESPSLTHSTNVWLSVLALSIFGSAFAFIAQTTAQQHTSATHAGLIFTLEPIFAAFFAFIFIGETLSTKGYIGAALVLAGILFAEFDLKKLFFKQKVTGKVQI
ncbi:DMT family transporter [Bacillus massiliigorillae]|uniref:DMT family transporter n=1 Tax=Bacillus massiliigorillae TaxID=1243664 RepID=UPI00039F42B4|nr:DMT family transporter [Bacillus massiliigorillae]